MTDDRAAAPGPDTSGQGPVARLDRVPRSLPEILIGLGLTVLVLFVGYSVAARYLLSRSMAFSDEFARLLFVWLVFVGSAVALGRNEHIGVGIVTTRMPPGVRRYADLITDAAILVLSSVLLWSGYLAVQSATGQRLPVMRISTAWMYAAVPVSALLMIGYGIRNLTRHVRGLVRGSLKNTSGEGATRFAEGDR